MSDDKKREDFGIELGDRRGSGFDAPPPPKMPPQSHSTTSSPLLPILAYCGSSILMTVTNKYVLSDMNFNLNFFLLCVQSVVCVMAIQSCKSSGIITYRDFNSDEAKKWFPISLLLIGMIYTSTKALQFLSIPVYTIFKNLTIILIAYGEVLWFGGSVTVMALFSFGLMVLSSVIAAWADIQHALQNYGGHGSSEASDKISTLNAGYIWMMLNCFCSAAYVLGMRKRIKLTNFKDFDTMYYNNLLSIPILLLCSLFLENWSSANIAKNFPTERRNAIILAMVFSGLSSVFISYTSAWCVRVTSSTTYSMVGALNKLPIALSGLIFFDAPVTLPSVSAIAVGFVSGIVYALAKVRQSAGGPKTVLPTMQNPMSASSQSMRDSFKS
ncbi:GDP-mannose transporter 1 [Cryomyces minteri]|uniref:GDP-mannose transporter n=1 Tax=Cryomyces minteri TaxID=331657 RepID=A0A4U0XD66_9PEZI|nr:GDP-mannose transporter 1 [Cryomyces minteri]